MLISDHANLPENKSGFWIEKLYGEDRQCSFLVFHQGLTCFGDSIGECKQKLKNQYQYIETNNRLIVEHCRKTLRKKVVYELLNDIEREKNQGNLVPFLLNIIENQS